MSNIIHLIFKPFVIGVGFLQFNMEVTNDGFNFNIIYFTIKIITSERYNYFIMQFLEMLSIYFHFMIFTSNDLWSFWAFIFSFFYFFATLQVSTRLLFFILHQSQLKDIKVLRLSKDNEVKSFWFFYTKCTQYTLFTYL